MRPSERRGAPALALLALLAGCGSRLLVVVDPDPCADGGTLGCLPPSLLDDLVGWWRFDDAPGSMIALDSSTRGNNGTLVGLNPATAWVAGRVSGALRVDAAGFVEVPPSPSIEAIGYRLTVAAWVYFDGSIVDWGTAASRQIDDTYDQHYHLSLNIDGRPSLFVVTDAPRGVLMSAPDPVPRATWVHLAATYDGETARLFVDGQQAASMPITGSIATDETPLILAGNGNPPNGTVTERFPGRLDEIMLYRRALTPDEISQLHDGPLFSSNRGAE